MLLVQSIAAVAREASRCLFYHRGRTKLSAGARPSGTG